MFPSPQHTFTSIPAARLEGAVGVHILLLVKRGTRWVRVATGAIKEIRQINMSLKSLNASAGILNSAVIQGKLCSWQTFIQWPFNSS